MKKIIIAVFISFVLTIALTAYSDSVQTDLRDNLVRLHIIANSDSDYDQSVKMRVRDAVLKNEKCCTQITPVALKEAERTAERVLAEYGADYGVHAEYGKFYFPKKEYKNMILPCGEYYGVRIVLGNGEGHNWWCVMYPPLCMTNDNEAVLTGKSERVLKDNLSAEAYDVITENNGEIKIKFRIVEAVQNIKGRIERTSILP